MIMGPNNLDLNKWVRLKEIGFHELMGLDFSWP